MDFPIQKLEYKDAVELKGEGFLGLFKLFSYRYELPAEQLLEAWKAEIERDFDELMKKDPKEYNKAEQAVFVDKRINREDVLLFCIGKFILNKKSKWPECGNFKSFLKMTFSHRGDMSKFGEKFDTCLDIAVFCKLLTDMYGIKGSIKGGHAVWNGKKHSLGTHYLWQEDREDGQEGRILDIPFCFTQCGLVINFEDYLGVVTESKQRIVEIKKRKSERRKAISKTRLQITDTMGT